MYIPLLINPVLAVLVIIFINSLPHIPLIVRYCFQFFLFNCSIFFSFRDKCYYFQSFLLILQQDILPEEYKVDFCCYKLIKPQLLFQLIFVSFLLFLMCSFSACYLRRKVVHTSSEIDHFLCLIKNIASKERILGEWQ